MRQTRRRVSRGVLVGLLAFGIGVPAVAGAAVVVHHYISSSEAPFGGLNPDSKESGSHAALPTPVSGDTQRVGRNIVTLRVQPGAVNGNSCYELTERTSTGSKVASMSACGMGQGPTDVVNNLGVGVVYTADTHATRVEISYPGGRYERQLHAQYALTPQLPTGQVTITTYDASGKPLGHHTVSVG